MQEINKLMKKIALIIVSLIILLIIHHLFLTTSNVVKPAISLLKAGRLVKEDNYYIIYQDKGLFDEGYTTYCYDGKNKKPVVLIGKNPFNMHGDNGNHALFCSMARNKFLVKGQKVEKYQNIVDETVINVEEWEIISPVKRVYVDEYDHRYIYPINCIDEYDVKKGDYISDTVGEQSLYSWEVDYYLENEKNYYLIACQRESDELNCYLCSDGISDREKILTKKVELAGGYPNTNTFVGKKSDSQDRYNYILVKGTLDNNIIYVEEWKLAHTVLRDKNAGDNWHSSYFLDERD